MQHFLFLCTQNRYRSVVAEQLFFNHPTIQAKSAGTASNARRVITKNLIQWADTIVVMEQNHVDLIRKKFKADLSQKKIVCLEIPDSLSYEPEELRLTLQGALAEYL